MAEQAVGAVSRETVLRMAQRQVEFVRLPLMITFVRGAQPCINVRTNEMLLPEDLGEKPLGAIRSIVGHELGHPVVFPRTSHWGNYYIMVARRLGYAEPQDFANVIADAFVNHWNLTRTPWRQTFLTWARTFYTVTGPAPDPRWEFLVVMMQALLDELEGKEVFLKGRIDPEAFEILFHDERDLRQRYEDLAELLRGRLAGHPLKEQKKVLVHGPGNLPDLDPVEDAEEFRKWTEAVSGLGAGAGFEHIAKQHDRNACLFDVAELLAFDAFMVTEDEAAKAAKKPSGPAELVPWSPSDSPLDLRVADSLRQSGALIPGVTTLKRVDGVEKTEERQGRGTLFLIIDTSGSMKSSLGGMLILGWAAALRARKRGDRVAALEFSGAASYLLPPGHEYQRLKQVLQTLQAGGGTRICPALAKIVEVSRETRRKPTCLIVTDTDVSEPTTTVLEKLAEIGKLGGKSLVCVPKVTDVRSWVRDAQGEGLASAFVLNDLSSIHRALRALH